MRFESPAASPACRTPRCTTVSSSGADRAVAGARGSGLSRWGACELSRTSDAPSRLAHAACRAESSRNQRSSCTALSLTKGYAATLRRGPARVNHAAHTFQRRCPWAARSWQRRRPPRHRPARPAPLEVECSLKCETMGRDRALCVAIGQQRRGGACRSRPMMADVCRQFSHSSDTVPHAGPTRPEPGRNSIRRPRESRAGRGWPCYGG
jgi:hypothetical protein